MHRDSEVVKKFGQDIQRLIDGQDLMRERSFEMFKEVLLDEQPELQQGAFLSALVAKGETPQEIAGAWQAINEFDTVHVSDEFCVPVVENSGTGMDKIKTFNVSSAAAIVAAACGIKMARHGARALTSECGTVDILEAIGIDVECGISVVEKSIKETNIGLFNGMSALVHPRALFRILSQIRFGSTLNIAASLANPCQPEFAVRGVYSESLVDKVCAVMKEIGYKRGLVVHGFDEKRQHGMDEVSILGESIILEFFSDGREEKYSIMPEDVGIKRRSYSEIAPLGNLALEARRFLEVVAGRGCPACVDFTCLNAAAILFLTGYAKTLKKGVEISREVIASGRALIKLREWVYAQNEQKAVGISCFEKLLSAENIEKSGC